MTKLLNHVADKEMFTRFKLWIKEFLECAESDEAKRWMETSYLGRQLAGAYADAAQLFKAVAFLFQIDVPGEPSLQDAQYFLEYSGPVVWRRAVRGLLRNPEPQGSGFTKVKQESRDMLRSAYQEAVRTAATEGPALKLANTLQASLTSHDRMIQHRCCEPLAEVLKHLENLEKQLRKGGTQQLRNQAISFTREMTDKARCAFALCLTHAGFPIFCIQ